MSPLHIRRRRRQRDLAMDEVSCTIGMSFGVPILYMDEIAGSQDMAIAEDWIKAVRSGTSTDIEQDLGLIAGELRKLRLAQAMKLLCEHSNTTDSHGRSVDPATGRRHDIVRFLSDHDLLS